MMNLLTYTVQSVHGLQETFQVSPNGTIDTHQLCLMVDREEANIKAKAPKPSKPSIRQAKRASR
ncbi:hypothetical protein Q31b_01600 [Novipirellula aureliae]|uniref:Uncharacterized protein n=1 Tax=Novipirellula aureliae TaxID=2527966 RepID=A0A5C6ECS1_9BACT|nr:hypothetical protein [Novipirellula aureliae]TWU44989.1 hypothetical protein Q31b_01600 [Novipirellula aureliae]